MNPRDENMKEIEQKETLITCQSTSYDLIIIGSGPAGLFCAISSCPDTNKGDQGTGNKHILILEKNASPGRKLLISGSGQCNLTHEGDIYDFLDHYKDHGRLLRPALFGFTNQDLISFFETKGLGMVSEPGGKVFPQSRRARDVLNILIEECRKAEIEIQCQREVKRVSRTEGGFILTCDGYEYR